MTASLAASSPVLRRPLLSFAVRSDFLLKPRISARSSQWRAVWDDLASRRRFGYPA